MFVCLNGTLRDTLFLLWLAACGSATACGGVVAANDAGVDASAEANAPDACGPSCNGCCTTNGQCEPGTNADTCGHQGSTCVDCASQGKQCLAGVCSLPASCTPDNCKGCCQGNVCRSGTSLTACGVDAGSCVACPLGAACTAGACVMDTTSCSAANCIGCCIGTSCVSGNELTACGQTGAKCTNCSGSTACFATGPFGGGVCATSQSCSCPNGCCDHYLQCHTEEDALACGIGGSPSFCSVCSNDGKCIDGSCTSGSCSPKNCSGCCGDDGVCRKSTDLLHCGLDGGHCVGCPSGTACQKGACVVAPTCGPQNCAGCCDANGNCNAGMSNANCGVGGVQCTSCGGGTQCLQSTCQ